MKRGRKPTPTALKLLKGNPGKRAIPKGEPKPGISAEVPSPPTYLTAGGKRVWRKFAAELHRLGILTTLDTQTFENYCEAYARMRLAKQRMDETGGMVIITGRKKTTRPDGTIEESGGTVQYNPFYSAMHKEIGLMRGLASSLGLDPSERARMNLTPEKTGDGADPMERFLADSGL